MSRPYPLIEYAQKIGKNTSELTAADMTKFMKWWITQQPRKDLPVMAKSYTTKKYQDAQMSRLAEQGIESPINNGEEEIVLVKETVAEMGLTQVDVSSLIWGLETLLNEYDLEENEIGVCFKELLSGLKEV